MSSHASGRLRVQRNNANLLAIAQRTLDPQRFSAWVAAGRAGALEAARLLDGARSSRVEALASALGREGVPLAFGPAELLTADRDVLVAAASEALQCAGFRLDCVDARDEGFSLVGRRGEQTLAIRLEPDNNALVVDAGIPGFLTTDECESARDDVLSELERLGVNMRRPADPGALTEAVSRALPNFRIDSLVADDELQIVAYPEETE